MDWSRAFFFDTTPRVPIEVLDVVREGSTRGRPARHAVGAQGTDSTPC